MIHDDGRFFELEMVMRPAGGIHDVIGPDHFRWLAKEFNMKTRLEDVPEGILLRLASIDIAVRDYGRDPNAVTGIALITFAYRMAGRVPEARFGPKDLVLLKILAKNERLRREGGARRDHWLWRSPLFELITGQVGERLRAMRMMNSPNAPALDRFDNDRGL